MPALAALTAIMRFSDLCGLVPVSRCGSRTGIFPWLAVYEIAFLPRVACFRVCSLGMCCDARLPRPRSPFAGCALFAVFPGLAAWRPATAAVGRSRCWSCLLPRVSVNVGSDTQYAPWPEAIFVSCACASFSSTVAPAGRLFGCPRLVLVVRRLPGFAACWSSPNQGADHDPFDPHLVVLQIYDLLAVRTVRRLGREPDTVFVNTPQTPQCNLSVAAGRPCPTGEEKLDELRYLKSRRGSRIRTAAPLGRQCGPRGGVVWDSNPRCSGKRRPAVCAGAGLSGRTPPTGERTTAGRVQRERRNLMNWT